VTQIIVGAGMAGLLCACLMPHHKPRIVEAQGRLPNNHSAVLRFRSPLVGEVLGLPFRKVRVIKAALPWRNPVADALAYAQKCTGTYRSDRSMPQEVEEVERWIAPPDLISRMSDRCELVLDQPWDFSRRDAGKVISTIPMPDLMTALDYPGQRPEFKSVTGVNLKARVRNSEAHATLYVPDPNVPFSRITLTGEELVLEFPRMTLADLEGEVGRMVEAASALMGLSTVAKEPRLIEQRYHKIEPIPDQERRAFIFWASTVQDRAFSLGRFACWRPGLLLDDLVKDIRLIDGWVRSGTPGYSQVLHASEWR
jgi:hypothetical protein